MVIGIPFIRKFVVMPAIITLPSSSNRINAGLIFEPSLSANPTLVMTTSPGLGMFPTAVVSFTPEFFQFGLMRFLPKNSKVLILPRICNKPYNCLIVRFPRVSFYCFQGLNNRFLQLNCGYLIFDYDSPICQLFFIIYLSLSNHLKKTQCLV